VRTTASKMIKYLIIFIEDISVFMLIT